MKIVLICFALLSLMLVSCSDEGSPVTPLPMPTTYDSTNWRTNASNELLYRANFSTFVSKIKTGRTAGVVIAEADLLALYNNVSALVSLEYDAVVKQSISELSKASGGTFLPEQSVLENGNGGTYSGYLFDEYGIEHEQLIEKGLFAGALYNRVCELLKSDVNEATINKVLVLYGAHPSFPNTGSAVTNPDILVANYAARRDKNDGSGFYTRLALAFIAAKHYAKLNNSVELAKQVATIKKIWEQVEMATVVNYCYSVVSTLSKTSPTTTEKASAIHALGECIGFVKGFKGLPAGTTVITGTQIESILTLLKSPSNGAPSCYEFWKTPAESLPQLLAVTELIQSIYGFTNVEMEDFKKNWVSEQNRK